MNFKRNLLTIISLMGSVFAIASCSNKNAFSEFSYIPEVVDTHEDEVFANGAYVKPGNYSNYKAIDKHGNEVEFGSFYETSTTMNKKKIIESTGDRKILVVPVDFYGYTCSKLNIKESEYIDNLNKAFFGSAKNNRYVSVAEYYNHSSYGKLRISGKVCDKFYTFLEDQRISIDTLDTFYAAYTRNTVYDEYPKIIKWYEETYQTSIDEFRLDPNNPNSEVAMYLVYTYPARREGNTNLFWAYTFEERPLSWTSYSTLYSETGLPDAHTFIHETGHLLGLVDYYPTGENGVNSLIVEPAGKIDMMDCSIGDHSAMSKMMLNWARPYHVKDSCTINLRALNKYGDIILISDNWNGTVFDEYYLIEFYNPFDLNAFDVNNGNDEAKLPSLPGIKIHHVDARIAYFVKKGANSTFSHYCDEVYEGEIQDFGNYVTLAHDNTTYPASTNEQKVLRNYLYELQLNKVGHPVASSATNENLFHRGDTFEVSEFNNSLNLTNYSIKVSDLSFYNATVEITKNNKSN